VAARTDESGVVVHAVGPFADEADARSHVAGAFGGRGYPVPLELAFRAPRPP
jgi:hypothetical protein